MLEEQKSKAEQPYVKYWNLMCHVAMEILQNSADTEDAVQQAFLYLLLHMDKLEDIDSPSTKAYVSLTAKHRAIDLYRSRRRYEPADISGMRTTEIHHERLGVMRLWTRSHRGTGICCCSVSGRATPPTKSPGCSA